MHCSLFGVISKKFFSGTVGEKIMHFEATFSRFVENSDSSFQIMQHLGSEKILVQNSKFPTVMVLFLF